MNNNNEKHLKFSNHEKWKVLKKNKKFCVINDSYLHKHIINFTNNILFLSLIKKQI